MKKLLLINLILVLFSCKTNVATKLDNKSESSLKGNWKITAVTFSGSEYLKVKSFEIADSKCFIGSTWNFVSNNNTGEMALTDASCSAYSSKLTWYINKENNMTLKFLGDSKAKKVEQGFVLKVVILSDDSFQLIDKFNVGGKLSDIVYHFEKSI